MLITISLAILRACLLAGSGATAAAEARARDASRLLAYQSAVSVATPPRSAAEAAFAAHAQADKSKTGDRCVHARGDTISCLWLL